MTTQRDDRKGDDQQHGHSMDRELVSGERHELDYLAEIHGTSADEVEKIIKELGTRSRRRIEEALDQRFKHRSRSGASSADRSSDAAGRSNDERKGERRE